MRPAFYIRVRREESLTSVAKATGLDGDTISAFERGDVTMPAPRTLNRLAKHYGVGIKDLLEERASEPEAAA